MCFRVSGVLHHATSRSLFGTIVNAKIIGRFSPFLMSAIGH
ncbi:hypothetical protein ECENVIRA811_3667 [Escherichia coli Envira 8/11]|nr:hypothetical protein ECENVIRA811_3667 [Escherichia coli Envira 8/11]EMX73224.1 hypothetical protein ECENVIRA101_1381 [Escherichia coli Envira 10/1]